MATVQRYNAAQRWRFACPRGHSCLQFLQDHVYCTSCQTHGDVDPRYEELLDKKRDEVVDYGQITIEEGA